MYELRKRFRECWQTLDAAGEGEPNAGRTRPNRIEEGDAERHRQVDRAEDDDFFYQAPADDWRNPPARGRGHHELWMDRQRGFGPVDLT